MILKSWSIFCKCNQKHKKVQRLTGSDQVSPHRRAEAREGVGNLIGNLILCSASASRFLLLVSGVEFEAAAFLGPAPGTQVSGSSVKVFDDLEIKIVGSNP